MHKANKWMISARNGVVATLALTMGGLVWGGGGVTGTGRFFGEATDFASIYVNGIHFSIDTANIRIKGNDNQPESALRKGMGVRVEGTINPDGVTGTATLVEYLGDIEGAIDAAPIANGKIGSFTIYGLVVRTDAATKYDGVSGLSALAGGHIVEVSGYFNAGDGSFAATRIEKKNALTNGIDLHGVISSVTPTTFVIGNLTVTYDTNDLRDIPNDTLANGMYVNVKSDNPPVANAITARRVNGEDALMTSSMLATQPGIVKGVAANITPTGMRMGNIPITIGPSTVFDGAPQNTLYPGVKAIASGAVVNGVMAAAAITIAPQLVSAVSVKSHGTAGSLSLPIDTNADIAGPLTVEPRLGTSHTLVFTFNGPVTSLGYTGTEPVPNVTSKDAAGVDVGTVDSVVMDSMTNTVTVTLSGIANTKRTRVTLNNINQLGVDVPVVIGFLVGDVDSNGKVEAADAAAAKGRAGQVADAVNLRFDLNASGTINSGDIAAIKARSGNSQLVP